MVTNDAQFQNTQKLVMGKVAKRLSSAMQANGHIDQELSGDGLAQYWSSSYGIEFVASFMQRFGEYRDAASVELLIAGLNSPSEHVQATAIRALRQIGYPAASAAPKLLSLLRNGDQRSQMAGEALANIRDVTIVDELFEELRKTQNSQEGAIPFWLLGPILALYPDDERVFTLLANAAQTEGGLWSREFAIVTLFNAHHRVAEVRELAQKIFVESHVDSSLGNVTSQMLLLFAGQGSTTRERHEVMEAFKKVSDRDPSAFRREGLYWKIAEIPAPEVTDFFRHVFTTLTDSKPDVAISVGMSLVGRDDVGLETMQDVRDFMYREFDRSEDLRRNSLDLLARTFDNVTLADKYAAVATEVGNHFIALLEEQNHPLQMKAMRMLGALRCVAAVPLLASMLAEHDNLDLRIEAALALEDIHDETALSVLDRQFTHLYENYSAKDDRLREVMISIQLDEERTSTDQAVDPEIQQQKAFKSVGDWLIGYFTDTQAAKYLEVFETLEANQAATLEQQAIDILGNQTSGRMDRAAAMLRATANEDDFSRWTAAARNPQSPLLDQYVALQIQRIICEGLSTRSASVSADIRDPAVEQVAETVPQELTPEI